MNCPLLQVSEISYNSKTDTILSTQLELLVTATHL